MLRIKIADDAAKRLGRLPARHAQQIDARILRLAVDPFPPVSLKLQGTTDIYRVRQGPYRIVYRVNHAASLLLIEAIGDRKGIYRKG